VTFEVREEAVGVGQPDSIAKYGIGETVGRSQVLEDDYGIAVKPERFKDIVSGVDPSKFVGSGRIGEDMRKGFGYSSGPGGKRGAAGIENNANEVSVDLWLYIFRRRLLKINTNVIAMHFFLSITRKG